MEIVESSLERLWISAAAAVLHKGERCKPRGIETREIVGMQLVMKCPQDRVPHLPVRKFSLAYGLGELAWYLWGTDSLDFIKYYAPSYGKYSDDGKRLHGAYGPRIFSPLHRNEIRGNNLDMSPCPWVKCVSLLKKDPDTRQAVLPIFDTFDLGMETKDMPCTLSLQFLVRGGKLDLVVNMRSNDLWFGGVYDMFCFTAIQELMANELGIPMGTYYHHVGSFHLYEKNAESIERCLSEYDEQPRDIYPIFMDKTLPKFTEVEYRIRMGTAAEALDMICKIITAWSGVAGLHDLAQIAWLWKRVNEATEIKEEQRRYARMLVKEWAGRTFDMCFH